MEKSACKDWEQCNKIIFTGINNENQNFSVYRTQKMKVEYILNKLTKRYLQYLSPLLKFNGTNKNVNNLQRENNGKYMIQNPFFDAQVQFA